MRLGLRHAWECWRLLQREQPERADIPVAMTPLGYLRDAFFLLLARAVPTSGRHPRRLVIHAHGGHFGDFYRTSPAPMPAPSFAARCAG